MGSLHVVVSDELEQKVREKAFARFGLRKGALARAVAEALETWLKEKV